MSAERIFISEAQVTARKEDYGRVTLLALPLYRREPFLPVVEAMPMTGFTHHQLERFLANQRGAKVDPLPSPLLEDTSKAKARGQIVRNRGFTEQETNSYDFVRELLIDGVVTEDLVYWNALNILYTREERPLLENFADRIRLEVYLQAVVDVTRGNALSIADYRILVSTIDFSTEHAIQIVNEEQFITTRLGSISNTAFPEEEVEGLTRQRIYKAKPSVKRNRVQPADVTIGIFEAELGRPLTDLEREHIVLTSIAREVPKNRGRMTLQEFYTANERQLKMAHRDIRFLELFYATKICHLDRLLPESEQTQLKEKGSFVDVRDVSRIYGEKDPTVFQRRREDIAFIREHVSM